MCRYIALLLVCAALHVHGQQAFNDSLDRLAPRIADRILTNGHTTVALLPITDASGARSALGDHIGSELMYRLLAGDHGLQMVERSGLNILLEEQRLSATGLTRANGSVALGQLKEAGVFLTGTLVMLSHRQARLEMRTVNTTKGTVEGLWRVDLDVPDELGRAERTRLTAQRRADQRVESMARRQAREASRDPQGWRLGVNAVGGSYFGQWHTGAGFDLRKTSRVSLGFRGQWMPLGGYIPQQVGFGHFTTDMGSFMYDDPWGGRPAGTGGEVYLTPANDASFGVQLLSKAMDQRVSGATWSQVRVTTFQAQRYSFMLPVRFQLAPAGHGRMRPYMELGYGLDVVTTRSRYEGVSVHVAKAPDNSYTVTPGYIGSSGRSFGGTSSGFHAWNMLLGGGVEVGRFSIGAEWRHAFHAQSVGLGGGRKIAGDPVAVALLNGAAVEDGQVLGELGTHGAIQFGRIDSSELQGHRVSMDRFLDRSYFQFNVGFRF